MAKVNKKNYDIENAPAWKIAISICTLLGIGFSAGGYLTLNLYESKIERINAEHNTQLQLEREKYKDFIIEQKEIEIKKLNEIISNEKSNGK